MEQYVKHEYKIHYETKICVMKTLNYVIILFLFSVVALFGCNREENLTFEDWDNDNDALIDYQEFEETFTSNYYNDWNQDNDPYLDDEDFLISTFDLWDLDNDAKLSEEEWLLGFDHYFGKYVGSAYEVVDTNDDGFISFEEYQAVLDNTGYFRDWDVDTDDNINEEELSAGVFKRWDLNNDGVINAEEYMAFDRYYLDI